MRSPHPGPAGSTSILPPWKPICPRVRPERFVRRAASRPWGGAQAAVTSASIIVPSPSSLPQGRTGRSSPALLRTLRPQASVASEPAGVISPVLALFSFVESAPRAYRLKVGNADLFRKSTEHGTTSPRAIQNSKRAREHSVRCEEKMGANTAGEDQHPWTNGLVERMNRTIKEATVQRYHHDRDDQLQLTLPTFLPPTTKLGGWRP